MLIALAVVLLLLALLVASPVIAILLIVVALLFAGCGLSWYFGDDRWFDVYALIAIGLLGAFLAEAVAAAWWLVWGIPTAIELDLIIGNFDDVCASGGGPWLSLAGEASNERSTDGTLSPLWSDRPRRCRGRAWTRRFTCRRCVAEVLSGMRD